MSRVSQRVIRSIVSPVQSWTVPLSLFSLRNILHLPDDHLSRRQFLRIHRILVQSKDIWQLISLSIVLNITLTPKSIEARSTRMFLSSSDSRLSTEPEIVLFLRDLPWSNSNRYAWGNIIDVNREGNISIHARISARTFSPEVCYNEIVSSEDSYRTSESDFPSRTGRRLVSAIESKLRHCTMCHVISEVRARIIKRFCSRSEAGAGPTPPGVVSFHL